jgi:hypothetical protein
LTEQKRPLLCKGVFEGLEQYRAMYLGNLVTITEHLEINTVSRALSRFDFLSLCLEFVETEYMVGLYW